MSGIKDGDEERVERTGGKRALPTFNGKKESFPVWKARVRAWLQAESPPLLYVLEEAQVASSSEDSSSSSSGVGKAEKKKLERQERDRLKVYNALISSLDDTHVGIVVAEVAEGDAVGAWKILLRRYESDGEVLFCLLEGLPTDYEMVRQALEVQDVVDLEVAFVHLREMEDKIRRRGVKSLPASAEGALNMMNAEGRPREKQRQGGASSTPGHRRCPVCRSFGHSMWDCPDRCESGCFRCGSDEHMLRECKEKVQKKERSESEYEDSSDNRNYGRPSTPVPGRYRSANSKEW